MECWVKGGSSTRKRRSLERDTPHWNSNDAVHRIRIHLLQGVVTNAT